MDESAMLILGANGQLGRALVGHFPGAIALTRGELDIGDPLALLGFDWGGARVVINAAAYTDVDGAETPAGRVAAWAANAAGPANLAAAANRYGFTLVHISSDYVFDGTEPLHQEGEPFSPLGVYGQTKAAGDVATGLVTNHYIVRTSWVIGDGANFVRSILSLGPRGISPAVVADQFGRLTFTDELVRVISHLLDSEAPFGTYNASNSGDIVSWADIARQIYEDAGYTQLGLSVSDTTADEYFAGKVSSPRPMHSGLDLSKLHDTGFEPIDWRDNLRTYLANQSKTTPPI